ncbi:MAG: hypothetical protein H0U52_14750 [Chloroflexi bacterium]|nr:hypothetical protein [Chloroflexota bacterium]
MSADPFETELRDLLRTESAAAPVQMSLADLRARAGKRARWAWTARPPAMRVALAGGAFAAVGIALALGLGRGQRPADVGATPSPIVSPDSSGSQAVPSPSPFVLQPVGTVVIARVDGTVVTILNQGPSAGFGGAPRVLGTVHVPAASPELRVEPDGVQALGPNGDVLLTLSSGDGETQVRTSVLVKLGEIVSLDRVVPAGHGTFAPNGTLVIADASTGTPKLWVVDRASSAGRTLAVPADVSTSGRRPILTTDGTGIVAVRPSGPDGTGVEDIILGLDGSVRPMTTATSIDLVTGGERRFGLHGERLGGGCDSGGATGGGCVSIVLPLGAVNANGTNITPPGRECCSSQIWTPDGKRVVMLTGDEIWAWDASGINKVGTLEPDVSAANPTIVGFISQPLFDYVLIDSDVGTTAVAMDGASMRTLDGTLLSVVR